MDDTCAARRCSQVDHNQKKRRLVLSGSSQGFGAADHQVPRLQLKDLSAQRAPRAESRRGPWAREGARELRGVRHGARGGYAREVSDGLRVGGCRARQEAAEQRAGRGGEKVGH